jgi:hypothetical protein
MMPGARQSVCVGMGLLLTFLASLPLLLSGTGFWDDWAWVGLYQLAGPNGIQDAMMQVRHPGYGPYFNFLFWLDPLEPWRPARIFAVAFHMANGYLLWRLFVEARSGAAFALSVAVLYLISPFLGNLRGTLSHTNYDAFIFFYLLSIFLVGRRSIWAVAAAVVTAAIGLSIETLAMLEVFRWWYLYRRWGEWRVCLWRAAPFVVLACAVVAIQFWLGSYSGYSSLRPLGVSDIVANIFKHLSFFVLSLEPVRYVGALFIYDDLWIAILLAVVTAALGIAQYRLSGEPSDRDLIEFAVLGVVILGAGMLPYVLAGRTPGWTAFGARFAVVSQFGVLILGATLIQLFRGRPIRAAALAVAAFVFAGIQIQFGKWMLYDEQVMHDFIGQLGAYTRSAEPQLFTVRFSPSTRDVLYLKRCLYSYDINVPLNLAKLRNGSFVVDQSCGGEQVTAQGNCSGTGISESGNCPAPRTSGEFLLKEGMERFTRLRLLDLVRRVLSGAWLDTGTLTIDPPSHSIGAQSAPR